MRINSVHNNINFNGYKAILAYGTTDKNVIDRYTLLAVKLDNEGKKDLENYHNLLRYYKDNISGNKSFDNSDNIISIFYKRYVNPVTGKIHRKYMFLNDIEIKFGEILKYNRKKFKDDPNFQNLEKFTIKINSFIADLTKRIEMQKTPLYYDINVTKDLYIYCLDKIKNTGCIDTNSLKALLNDASRQKVKSQSVATFLNNVILKSMNRYLK